MNALIFTGDRNAPGKKDWSHAFRPEALAFMKLRKVPAERLCVIDVSAPSAARRAAVIAALNAPRTEPLELIAFFCHGLRSGLQLGHGNQSAGELAAAIRACSRPDVRVALYACSAAGGEGPGGDGGFADVLRDALCAAGATDCRVDAHETAGHTTQNPRVRRFEGGGSPVGGTGGAWLVQPGSLLWKPWVRALRGSTLRFRFPTMSAAEIHRELLGGGNA